MNESDRVMVATLMWMATHGGSPPRTGMQEDRAMENLRLFEKWIEDAGMAIRSLPREGREREEEMSQPVVGMYFTKDGDRAWSRDDD